MFLYLRRFFKNTLIKKEFKNFKKCLRYYDIFKKYGADSNNRVEVLCFGSLSGNNERPWPIILGSILNRQVKYFFDSDTCNEVICSNILKYCTLYKPKTIYVCFSDLLLLPNYTPAGIKSTNYENESKIFAYEGPHTPYGRAAACYMKAYFEVNIFLRFVFIFKNIETFCKVNNINFFWYSNSYCLKVLQPEILVKYLNTNTFLNEKGKLLSLLGSDEQEQIATNFAKITV